MRLSNFLVLSCVYSFIASMAHAQAFYSVSGQVLDVETKQPVPGVHVISKSGIVTTSANGHFTIGLDNDSSTWHLTISCVGYVTRHKSYTHRITYRSPGIFDTVLLSPSTHMLEQAVVTATRQPQQLSRVTQSMEIISPQLVQNTLPASADELIERMSGVQVLKGQANIRGGSGFTYGAGSRVLILLDGMPLLTADASDVKWDYLPLENLGSVEIIKGASSTLYGSSAMGGIIHFQTAMPTAQPYTSVSLNSGFYQLPAEFSEHSPENPFIQQLQLAHRRKAGRFLITSGVNMLTGGGFRQGDDSRRLRGNINARWLPESLPQLTLGASANAMFTEGTNFLFAGDMSNPYLPATGTSNEYSNRRVHFDQFTRYRQGNRLEHNLRWRYFHTLNVNELNQNSSGEVFFGEYLVTCKLVEREHLSTGISAGAGNIWQWVTSDSLYGHHSSSNQFAFIELNQRWKRLSVVAGARIEQFTTDTFELERATVFRGGVNYRLLKATWLRASAGEGFRYPSIAERFTSTKAGNIRIFPNPGLLPEKGHSLEAGIKQGFAFRKMRAYADVAAFSTNFENLMEFVFGIHPPPGHDPFNTFQYIGFAAKNITSARITGIESVAGAEMKNDNYKWNIYGGYTYIYPVDLLYETGTTPGDSGQFLKYRMQHIAKAQAEAGYSNFELGIYANYNSYMINIDKEFNHFIKNLDLYRNGDTGGNLTFDSRLSYRFTNYRLSVMVKNIFNRQYMLVPGNIEAPRSFYLQLRMVFNKTPDS